MLQIFHETDRFYFMKIEIEKICKSDKLDPKKSANYRSKNSPSILTFLFKKDVEELQNFIDKNKLKNSIKKKLNSHKIFGL